MWTNAIKHAAWLVKCDDDTPADVVKVRCEAANTIKKQWDEIKSLQAVVAKLPKTADGVPVVLGIDSIWARSESAMTGLSIYETVCWLPSSDIAKCYSTEAAARAAKESNDEE